MQTRACPFTKTHTRTHAHTHAQAHACTRTTFTTWRRRCQDFPHAILNIKTVGSKVRRDVYACTSSSQVKISVSAKNLSLGADMGGTPTVTLRLKFDNGDDVLFDNTNDRGSFSYTDSTNHRKSTLTSTSSSRSSNPSAFVPASASTEEIKNGTATFEFFFAEAVSTKYLKDKSRGCVVGVCACLHVSCRNVRKRSKRSLLRTGTCSKQRVTQTTATF